MSNEQDEKECPKCGKMHHLDYFVNAKYPKKIKKMFQLFDVCLYCYGKKRIKI
jgi:hypothetical protein